MLQRFFSSILCSYFLQYDQAKMDNKCINLPIMTILLVEKNASSVKKGTDNMKFFFRERKNPTINEVPKTQRELLLEDLEKTKCELDTAYRGFDYVTDPDLIDCYIYDINAILKRYKYLLEQVEETNREPEPVSYPSDTKSAATAFIS